MLWQTEQCTKFSIYGTKHSAPALILLVTTDVGLAFESVDEILKCDYSNESY